MLDKLRRLHKLRIFNGQSKITNSFGLNHLPFVIDLSSSFVQIISLHVNGKIFPIVGYTFISIIHRNKKEECRPTDSLISYFFDKLTLLIDEKHMFVCEYTKYVEDRVIGDMNYFLIINIGVD